MKEKYPENYTLNRLIISTIRTLKYAGLIMVKWSSKRVDNTDVETLRKSFLRAGGKNEPVRLAYKTNKIRALLEGDRL